MAISYPVNVATTRWAVVRQSNGQIIARNQSWPRPDGGEIQGLDPDYVYLLDIRFLPSNHPNYVSPPNYDSRFYSLQSVETIDIPNNKINLSYNAVKRDLSEQIISAENKELEELQKHISFEKEIVETRLAVSAIATQLLGQQLPPKASEFLSSYKTKGVKLWKNRGRLNEILDNLNSGLEPNLDAGWENV